MALEPITRQEKIIAGQDLTPITRMEMFLKNFGGGGGSAPAAGGVTTLHINVTAINGETMEATFTADKTPAEIQQASANGPVWCVLTFEAGTMEDYAVSIGIPPAWVGGNIVFGMKTWTMHDSDGNNKFSYAVARKTSATWILDLSAFRS